MLHLEEGRFTYKSAVLHNYFVRKRWNRCTSFASQFETNMPQRNRIPLEHHERIIWAFEDQTEDYILLVDT